MPGPSDPAKQAAGRAGGLATLNRHGVDHYRACGRLGGRPTRAEALAKALAELQRAAKWARG